MWANPPLTEIASGCNPCKFDFPAPYTTGDTWFGAEALDTGGKTLRVYSWCRRSGDKCPPYEVLP